jgi:hypothetical protein
VKEDLLLALIYIELRRQHKALRSPKEIMALAKAELAEIKEVPRAKPGN